MQHVTPTSKAFLKVWSGAQMVCVSPCQAEFDTYITFAFGGCARWSSLLIQCAMAERKRKLDIGGDEALAAVAAARTNPGVNPYNGRQYSQRYYDILSKRVGK